MKIVTILGARPQFIKASALSRAIKERKQIQEIIIHTGQHYDNNMSSVFFDQMKIPKPDHFLQITSKYHGEMTGRMMEGVEKVLLKEHPDVVLVYGDTNSTLAGALAAKKLNITLAHVEAGLRSYNMTMPEEINRILTDRISDILFCPSQKAVDNLNLEGFKNFGSKIFIVGDVMKDVARFYRDYARPPLFSIPHDFILCTVHRAENTDNPIKLRSIIEALNQIAEDIPIILPLHPRSKTRLNEINLALHDSLFISEPVGYLEMIYMLGACRFVITDSGGLQKEAYFFNRLCITVREETEWTELVECGVNKVVGSDQEKILQAKDEFLKSEITISPNLYGDGDTAKRIVDILTTV